MSSNDPDLDEVDRIAEASRFSGVVRVDRGTDTVVLRAYGLAHRALGVPNTTDTLFGIASGTKGLTALVVMSLVADGVLGLDTTARSVLGDDLRLIAGDVTIEHLLGHRSGIGDYLDEAVHTDATEYVLRSPHQLVSTEDYLGVLDGHPTVFPAGERFAYNNGGYVVLALIAERAGESPFADLVADRVCRPAGMSATRFARSDELPGRAAVGYLDADSLRTNVFHLPIAGSGDGGVYSTVADIHLLWLALFAGRIVPMELVREMTRPHSDVPSESMRYGLGFWLEAHGDAVVLTGADAGVSFRSVCNPVANYVHTVVSNTSEGAWPLARHLRDTVRA